MQRDKILIVLKHEFRQKLRSKAYIILTAIGPLLFVAMFALPILFASVNTVPHQTIAIIDSTGMVATAMSLKDTSSRSLVLSTRPAEMYDSLVSHVSSGDLSGLLVIGRNAISDTTASVSTLRMRNTSDFSTIQTIQHSYSSAIRAQRLKNAGIDPSMLSRLENVPDIQTMKIAEGHASKDEGGSFIAAYLVGFIIYMSLLLYGTMIMRSVIEEKGSRIIELLVSSIRPYDLLLGKVLGNALAAFLQIAVWAIVLGLLATVGVNAAQSLGGVSIHLAIPVQNYVYLVLFFVLGFLIYATLYATAGALADQDTDSQQASLPITLVIILGILFLTSVIQAPSSEMSVILSLIPLFSPILMVGRIFSETPPLWQILLSFVLMIATFFGVLWVAGRIYRVGILMYGKRFSFKEAAKWLRYS